jgi:hypothetical protein
MGAMFKCDVDGGTPHTSNRTKHKDTLAASDLNRTLNQLRARGENKWECSGTFKGKFVRNRGQDIGLCCGELRIGSGGQRHNTLPFGEADDSLSYLFDLAGKIAPQNRGKLYRIAVLGGTAANLPVDRINAGGANASENLAGADFRILDFLKPQLIHISKLFKNNCLHNRALLLLR